MRYIFLDIDGVLNKHRTHRYNKYCGFDITNVNHFNLILNQYPDVNLVLTSAWRYMILGKEITLKGFEYLMKVGGVHHNVKLLTHTVSDETLNTRTLQIVFAYHTLEINSVTDKVLVLDDLNLEFKASHFNFIKTESKVGLTKDQALLAIDLLRY